MANVSGYVTVYEAADGGTGDPANTLWQFFVGVQPVITKNHRLAATMRLAVETASQVRVSYNPANSNTMEQARIEYKYVCEKRKIEPCEPNAPGTPRTICETHRYDPCDPKEMRGAAERRKSSRKA